jgi:SAM-dependent methyltransferase
MPHDLSLNSGERQTATNYSAIRADHRLRYEWADRRIPRATFGVDAFCGNGYGTWLLSQSRFVIGIDGSQEAISAANNSFKRESNFYSASYFPFELPAESLDFVVALESIEHVPNGSAFFEVLCRSLKPQGTLIFSTPCEDFLPHHSTGNHFHFRHYTLGETLDLANSNGMELMHFAGQNTYTITPEGMQGGLLEDEQMILRESEPGQFIIVFCRKSKIAYPSTAAKFGE